MGFLSPWFLAGIAAVGLPLWLHLLRQFRRTPRSFSSLMFFERRVQSSTKHRRLRHLTLMALRMALLALVALAFADPFVNRSAADAERRTLTIVALDRSFSMHAGRRMAAAKAEAHRIVKSLGEQTNAQAVAFDSHIDVLTQAHAGKAALDAAIDSIEAGDDISSYGELIRSLRAMAQTSGERLDAHVITDVQQTSMPAAYSDLQAGPNISLAIHPVGSPDANWAVESVQVPASVYGSAPIRVTATVAGWQTPPATRRVSLEIDGRTLAAKDVVVPPSGRAEVEFTGFDLPHGAHRGRILISPGDSLPQDDSFAFSIERSDPRQVLFLYTSGRLRDAFYYKAALDASPAAGLIVQPFPLERLAELDLGRYSFVVLNNPGALDAGIGEKLASYVARGGAALIAVGPATASEQVIPVAGNSVSGWSSIQGAGAVDEQSPAMSGAGRFENVQFVQAARIAAKQADRILAKFSDGSPLLIEQRQGEGRILLLASTLDNSTSDFPLHTSFLPFVARTGAYLSGAETDPSSVLVGTPVLLRRTNAQNSTADVIGPEGTHLLSLNDATRVMTYTVAREGFYEVQRADRHRVLIAVHADRRESDLTPIPSDTLNLWRNTGASTRVPASSGAKTVVPRSLWRYLLTLALLAAFVESMFGMSYLSGERQTR